MKNKFFWLFLTVWFPCFAQTVEEKLFHEARRLYEIGQYEDAIKKLDAAVVTKPQYAEAFGLRGQCNLQLQDCNKARQDFQKALQFPFFRKQDKARIDALFKQDCNGIVSDSLEFIWAHQQDLKVEAAEFTIKWCVNGKKVIGQPFELWQNSTSVKKDTLQASRGINTTSVKCNVTITEPVLLKVGINEFYLMVRNHKSIVLRIFYVPTQPIEPKKLDRIALVIGNSRYKHTNSLNEQPLIDAARIRDALRKAGFEVRYRENLDTKDLKSVRDSFLNLLSQKNYEVSLFYFAGHGLHINGYNFVLPTDVALTEVNEVYQKCLSLDEYLEQVVQSKAKLNIVLTDACRDDPFKSLVPKLKNKAALVTRSVKTMQSTQSYFIVYPTVEGKTVPNDGLFTTTWLEMMQLRNRPDLEEIFQRVQVKVKEKSKGMQMPFHSTNFKGKFYFYF